MNMVRANIIFPKDLLLEVDKLVGPGKRSAFLAESVRKHLNQINFAKVARESVGMLDAKNYPHFSTAKKVRSYIRSFRKKNDLRFK
ncbi:hypothetical protein HYS92_00975 [Candidatus Daviesbacteria bacterium]|nr:hypothetical protein [Candidatus Daviesbacteria bacterium]